MKIFFTLILFSLSIVMVITSGCEHKEESHDKTEEHLNAKDLKLNKNFRGRKAKECDLRVE